MAFQRRSPRSGVVLARQLPRRLDGLGAARDEEDPVEVAWRDGRDLRRELDGPRVRVRPVDVERQLAHLRRGRLADLLAEAVADVDAEQAGERVEVALAVHVLEVAAVAADDHRHVAVGVAAHAGEVQPEMVARRPLQLLRCHPSLGRAHANLSIASASAFSRRRCQRMLTIISPTATTKMMVPITLT